MISKVVEINIQGEIKKKDDKQLPNDDIYYTLTELDRAYSDIMSSHRDLISYSEKLYCYSNFVVCRNESDIIVGIIAYYFDIVAKRAYIPYVCVNTTIRGKGIASKMMQTMISEVADFCETIELEVRNTNINAILLYKKYGFKENGQKGAKVYMIRKNCH